MINDLFQQNEKEEDTQMCSSETKTQKPIDRESLLVGVSTENAFSQINFSGKELPANLARSLCWPRPHYARNAYPLMLAAYLQA